MVTARAADGLVSLRDGMRGLILWSKHQGSKTSVNIWPKDGQAVFRMEIAKRVIEREMVKLLLTCS